MDRRNFLRTGVAASAALAFMPSMACSAVERSTGLILYTVRDEMAKDPMATLDKIAQLGFNWLEAANYSEGKFYNMKPSLFKKAIEDRGMQLISSHNGLNPDNVDEVVEAAAEAGLKYLVMPSLPGAWHSSLDGFKEAASFMNMAGQKCKANGMKLGFHNHYIEFMPIDGNIPYDILMANTDPDLVCFELDLAWIVKGKQNPVEYFEKYPGRFELLHIKDLSTELNDATLGEGTIDFVPIFEKVKLAGMLYFFIEQDSCLTHTSLESIKISRDYLFSNVF